MTTPIHFEPPFPMQEILGIGVLLLLLAVVSYLYGGKDVGPGKRLFLVSLRTLALRRSQSDCVRRKEAIASATSRSRRARSRHASTIFCLEARSVRQLRVWACLRATTS